MDIELPSITKKRGTNTSEKQKQILIEFIKKHPHLISGKQTQNYTYKDAANDWETIAAILNAIPGAHKEWKEWRKFWQDLRSRTKNKQSKNTQYARGTGGVEPVEEPLTKLEEDVLDVIKKVSLEGHAVQESFVSEFNDSPSTSAAATFSTLGSEESSTLAPLGDATNHLPAEHASCSEAVKIHVYEDINSNRNSKKKSSKKIQNLNNSTLAATVYAENLQKKIDIKQSYYERKIEILKRTVEVEERKAEALEGIKNVLSELI